MIEFKNAVIKKRFDKELIINDLIFESGCLVQICANNRVGKSLLMKTMIGEYPNFDGEILINKISVKEKSSKILIEREPIFLNNINVWKNIVLPLKKLSHEKKRRLFEFCEYAQINSLLQKKINTLSYSEKKMIEIIRAVIQYPFVLLIDDFDAYFDDEQKNIAKYFLDFASKAGTSVVVTTTRELDGFENFSIIENKLVKI